MYKYAVFDIKQHVVTIVISGVWLHLPKILFGGGAVGSWPLTGGVPPAPFRTAPGCNESDSGEFRESDFPQH